MKATAAIALLGIALINAPSAHARKTYEIKKVHKSEAPQLQAYDDTYCLFDNGKYAWCFDHNFDVEWGFEWIQTYSTADSIEYWRIRIHPYTQQYFIFHPELDLEDILYFETTYELTQFKASVFAELVMWYNGQICWGLGALVEDIIITITLAMKFEDCYKTIVESLTDWSQWTNGKVFDDCSPSNDEQVTVYIYNPIATDTTWYLWAPAFYEFNHNTATTSNLQCFNNIDWWPYAYPIVGFLPVYQSIFRYYTDVYGHKYST